MELALPVHDSVSGVGIKNLLGEIKLKNQLILATGLLFLSAVGIVMADDSTLQTDKDKTENKVDVDQKNLDASNKDLGDDKAAIQKNNDEIHGEKKDIGNDSKQLT